MRGVHIFEKPCYREIRVMRGRAMRGLPVIPKKFLKKKSTFWGTSFCPILAILAPQKQSAARPNISAQGDTPGLIWLYPTLIDVFECTRGQ